MQTCLCDILNYEILNDFLPKLHSTIENSEVIKIMIIIELECWLFPALSSFDQWKYSFIHSTTKKAQVTPHETFLWVWSRCSA